MPADVVVELHHRNEEPAVAVAYAVLGGAMVAQGRFEEAWHWLGYAARILQPGAEPNIGMHGTQYAGLISEILDLLARSGNPAPPPGSHVGKVGGRGGGLGVGPPREPLTHGETRVLRYLPTHLCALEIADEFDVSVNTVKTHVRHLYQKLGAHSRREAVESARAFGLLAPSPRYA